jgi:3-oxoacyl-[acyl-carrier protein] reductase
MDLKLAGRKALVTGATRGIGRAIAETLVDEGCDVAICARDPDQVAAAVAALGRTGRRTFGRAVDVADAAALNMFINEAAAALGGLDILVCNAHGVMGRGNEPETWRRGFEVDVMGVVNACEAAIPHIRASGGGAIVSIGSASIVEAVGPRRAYNSVKAAVLPYIKSLARNLAPENIRCNVVSPGQIFFEGGVWDFVKTNMPQRYEENLARNPLGRMGAPEEIAAVVAFVASPRAGFMTGSHIISDGGRSERVQY